MADPNNPAAGMPQMPTGAPGMQQQNPMMQMMQMMQMMGGGLGGVPTIDPAAIPFATGQLQPDTDSGLDSDIIRPATLANLVKSQQGVRTGSVLDRLCLTEDATGSLGGLPKGCTIAFAGPPGMGKTRTAISALSLVAQTGQKVAFVVAEEGFHDESESGRDDLASRMAKIGMSATGLDEAELRTQVLENIYVLESQYHKGQTWDDFVSKYRYLVEKQDIKFVVIDSLNMLDPTKHRTADNLSALKTYNHERGITALCIGQIKDTGSPVGGEALMHTADAVYLLEEMGLTSKDMAAKWGGNYRDRIHVIRIVKSVTTPIFPHPVRVEREAGTGVLRPHPDQPEEYALLPEA